MSVVDTLTGPATGPLYKIHVDKVRPADDNVRGDLGDLDGLASSIAEHGLVQPIVVHPHPDDDGTYEIVAGHRRHAAHLQAGLELIDAIVRARPDDGGAQTTAARIVENVQRQDLTVADEARAYARLADLGWSQRKIAGAVGVTQGHVSKRITLSDLDTDLLDAVDDGTVQVEQALSVAKLTRRAPASAREVVDAWRGADRWMAPYRLGEADRRLAELDLQEKRQQAVDEAERAHVAGDGPPVVDHQDPWTASRHGLAVLDRWQHADRDTCQADGTLGVMVDRNGTAHEVCTDPGRYEPEPDDTPREPNDWDRWREATPAREAFIVDQLTGDDHDPPAVTVLLWRLTRQALNDLWLRDDLLMRILQVDEGEYDDLQATLEDMVGDQPPASPSKAGALRTAAEILAVLVGEMSTGSPYSPVGTIARDHYGWLQEHGYTPAPVEARWLRGDEEGDTE